MALCVHFLAAAVVATYLNGMAMHMPDNRLQHVLCTLTSHPSCSTAI
jgi:hypothetical protein